jgi:23S rRNA pseudouridine1911/1915/1917 synthase
MGSEKNKQTAIEDRILLINDDIIVVNKLAGEAMEGAGKGQVDLPLLLAEHIGPVKKGKGKKIPPTAVHRLDVPVSGCALFARTPKALSFLNKAFAKTAFEAGRAEKYYWAVVENPKTLKQLPETGEYVHWIQTNTKQNKSTAYDKEASNRREAVLRYRLLEGGERYGFLELELVTGRHHQIRAQLAALGMPVKGDLKYGAARSEKNGGIRLHARSLYFPDPSVPGNCITVTADPPVMDNLWKDFH